MVRKIVITGGHLTPALAVIHELKKQGNWDIYYFGRKYSLEGEKVLSVESTLIPQLEVNFIPIIAGRLQRQFTRYTIFSLIKVPVGFFQTLFYLLKIKPDIICSFGGYVSVPAVISGWLLRIPILTHEQTIVFGLSSKINSFFANKIAISFPESLKFFPPQKVLVTGNPIREEALYVKKMPNFSIGKSSNYPIIYITGGNQGSRTINDAVFQILPELLKKYYIIHQSGDLDYEHLKSKTSLIDPKLLKNYFLTPYVGPENIGWILKNADLIISRAGANTVSEIAALGKPVIFIPIPWTYQDEQTKNALMLHKIGLAEIILQKDLSGASLGNMIEKMMIDLNQYKRHSNQAKKLVKLDAALKIALALNDLAKKE
jgi:UDP-N-acetylglucosamine--N-acetylmuramyl-(pentapeptide) pyrophosphoryl-undecaprenol N-acetylglucosamine transferase